MPAAVTPRQLLEAVLQGIPPARPLLLPIVFSAGARIQGLELSAFLKNPQKICNASRDIRGFLRADGIACYFDANLETGAIPIAAEVIRRLRSMLGADALLFAGVPGLFTVSHRLPNQEDPSGFLHSAASEFVEAGAHYVFIVEGTLPALSREQCQDWVASLQPTLNVIRFFGALPVLLLPDAVSLAANAEVLSSARWDCVLCPVLGGLRLPAPAFDAMGAGIALPLDLFQAAGSTDFALPASVQDFISQHRPALITTCGDVPATADPKGLAKVMNSIRALVQ